MMTEDERYRLGTSNNPRDWLLSDFLKESSR